jgi:hypothetical protein
VDLSFTLGDNFGTRPDLDALQFRIGHGFLGFGLAQLCDQFGIVDNQKGRTRRDVLTTADRDLRQPGRRRARRCRSACSPLSPCTSIGSGRARHQIAKPIMATKSTPVMTARGLRRTPRRAVALASVAARSNADGGAEDGGTSVIVL